LVQRDVERDRNMSHVDTRDGVRPLVIVEQLRQPVPGGIGRYVVELCRSLRKVGPIDTFSSVGPLAWPHHETLDVFRNTHFRQFLPRQIATKVWERGFGVPRSMRKAEVVHATSFATPTADLPCMTIFVHDVCWRRLPNTYTPRGVAWHEHQLERVRRGSATVLVPSLAVKSDLIEERFAPDRIHVVPEGGNHLPLKPRQSTDQILLSVCTMQPRKNIRRLIDAYKLVRARGIDLPLVLVGPSGWGAQLDESYRNVPGVQLAGHVNDDELAQLYARAAQLVFVPLEEGFGLPVVEAWHAGVPVVASQYVPCASENSGAALLVDPYLPEQVADAIEGLLREGVDTRAERVALGKRYVDVLSWEAAAGAHHRIWQGLE
jgi:glycosyltransferase involved in cell wall biosynthesis